MQYLSLYSTGVEVEVSENCHLQCYKSTVVKWMYSFTAEQHPYISPLYLIRALSMPTDTVFAV